MTDSYELMCPFLDQDPRYAFGVEFGLLWNRLKGDETVIEDWFTTDNQEQITLAANRTGWTIVEMQQLEEAPHHWTWIKMIRS